MHMHLPVCEFLGCLARPNPVRLDIPGVHTPPPALEMFSSHFQLPCFSFPQSILSGCIFKELVSPSLQHLIFLQPLKYKALNFWGKGISLPLILLCLLVIFHTSALFALAFVNSRTVVSIRTRGFRLMSQVTPLQQTGVK